MRKAQPLLWLASGLAVVLVAAWSAGLLPAPWRSTGAVDHRPGSAAVETTPGSLALVWTFEPPQRGAVLSSPLATDQHLYVATVQDAGLFSSGAVYCLARDTGRKVWKFDDEGHMLPTFSSPCIWHGRLYVGEGMHRHFTCKLYCLDADTGRKQWHFEAAGHIESSPCVVAGRVYFGAGDDGVYCLDARTGKQLWHFQGPLHIDASPAVVGGRLYTSSGVSLSYQRTEVLCLDAQSGSVVWRVPTDLPVWGSPTVEGDRVYFGLANGRFFKPPAPPQQPAGGVLCVAAVSGQVLWRRSLDAVFCRPAVHAGRVWVGSRDGYCYCLDGRTGDIVWKTNLGSPLIARPAVLDQHVYAVSSKSVYRLDANSGAIGAVFDVAAYSRTQPRIVASPAVVPVAGGGCRLYIGAELTNEANSAAVVYCLRD